MLMRSGWCTVQNTKVIANMSGTQAERPHIPMFCTMFSTKANNKLNHIKTGLAGSSSS